MPIQANVTNNQITASVGETKIDVTVSGGVGPTGAQGPSGEASLPAGTEGYVLTYVSGSWVAAAPASGYTLPTATASVLGGVKIGSGISIDGNGVISASAGYTLPTATGSVLGGVKIGSGVTITDGVISVSTNYAAATHTHAWGDITSGLPTTLAGYGITDAVASNDSRLSDARTPTAHNQAWSTITSTPTTLSGYGITDAVASNDSRLTDARTPTAHTHTASAITDFNTAAVSAVRRAVRSDVSSSTNYIGVAASGSATSASAWTIYRTIYTSAGAISSRATATSVKWDDRTTASYS